MKSEPRISSGKKIVNKAKHREIQNKKKLPKVCEFINTFAAFSVNYQVDLQYFTTICASVVLKVIRKQSTEISVHSGRKI